MKNLFYLHSEPKIHNMIKQLFLDFEIQTTTIEIIKKNKLKNKNVLLIINKSLFEDLEESFFLDNKVVIFFTNKQIDKKEGFVNTKFFYEHINTKRFVDEVTACFLHKQLIFDNTKIWDENIINTKTGERIFLTNLEKDILTVLFEKKQIEKNYLLEGVLKIKKDTETKTIESHLTRIRKKLSKINSQIEILSKENKIFLVS